MITHKYDDFFIGDTPPKDYYVYGWVCEEWVRVDGRPAVNVNQRELKNSGKNKKAAK